STRVLRSKRRDRLWLTELSVCPGAERSALRIIRVLLANDQELVEVLQQQVDQARLELLPTLLTEQLANLLGRPGLLVAAPRTQGIEDIRQRDDAPGNRDRLPRQPLRIALAIPALMMVTGDQCADLHQLAA